MIQIPCRLSDDEAKELDEVMKLLQATTRNGVIRKMTMAFRSLYKSNLERGNEITRLNNELTKIKSLIAYQQQLEQEEAKIIAESEARIKGAAKVREEAVLEVKRFAAL